MVKFLLFTGLILSGLAASAGNNVILRIGDNTIKKEDIKLKETVINNLFRKKYNRLPNINDQKLLNVLEFEWERKKLFLLLCKIIKKDIKKRYFDKVITQDTINQYIKKHRKNISEDITRHTMFLAAADYVKKSNEKDKYRIAYDKYKKLGMGNSYKFFKSAVTNEAYLKQLKLRINNLSDNTLSDCEKDMIFNQKLPDYIINKLSSKDAKIKKHLGLAKIHQCGYRQLLYMRWHIEQGEKMGVKIFDKSYGSSLKDILLYNLMSENKTIQEGISRANAISIATKAHNMKYDQSQPLKISLDKGVYTVVFPIKLPKGAMGPDYAAKVKIDAKTGKVLQVLVGS